MSRIILTLSYIIAGMFLILPSQSKAKTMTLKHYQSDPRYKYGLVLLKKTLENNNIHVTYEPFHKPANEARGEMLLKSGKVDFQFLSVTKKREQELRSIRIPIYYGLLGCRLLLVPKQKMESYSQVKNVSQLRTFVGGHGSNWGDLSVYGDNQLPVKTSPEYGTLFKMLSGGRFDYFHRGVSEIWSELDRWNKELAIAESIAIFYKLPVYFYVNKDNKELGDLIENSFLKAQKQENNVFKKIFLQFHGEMIKKANLDKRNMIVLKNNALPQDLPKLDTSSWMSEKHQNLLKAEGL